MNEPARIPIAATAADESPIPAVSWGAIFAGAFVAFAVSIALFTLGSGLGFSTISPWRGSGISLTTFGVAAAVWLIVVQWIASLFGGYIAGRLRTKWTAIHTDEVFFRDTAHGFVTWAVATAIMAALLSSGIASALSGTTQAAATVASGAAQGLGSGATQSPSGGVADPVGYFVDQMFRTSPGAAAPVSNAGAANGPDPRLEASRILVTGLANGDVPAADHDYLAQLVAARTGISQPDAAKRIDEVIAQAKAAADKVKATADSARKAAATFATFLFFSFLIGAFIACAAAALGGSSREHAETVVRS